MGHPVLVIIIIITEKTFQINRISKTWLAGVSKT